MKIKSLFFGVAFGSIIGSISALLTTPSSGKEIRAELKKTTDEWIGMINEVKVTLKELANSLQYLSKEGKDAAIQFTSDLKGTMEQWKKNIEPNNNILQNEISNIQKAINDLEEKLNNNQ